MRICFLSSAYPRFDGDGIASFVRSLAVALVELGHDVDVVAPNDPAVAPMEQHGVRVHRFRYPPYSDRHLAGHGRAFEADVKLRRGTAWLMPGFVVSGVARAVSLHVAERFDVLHTHWALPGSLMGYGASLLTGRPYVASLHGSSAHFAAANRLYRAVAGVGLGRARSVLACSPNLFAKALDLGADPQRTVVLPYGVDVGRYGQDNRSGAADLRSRWGVAPGEPLIGALGRLATKKGFDHLIGAMPAVLEAIPEARCVIGGDGDLWADLRTHIADLGLGGKVMLAGNVPWDDTPSFYAACDVVAVPSVVDPSGNTDGLPNVVLEAMASGRAVVGSDLAGIPLAIVHGQSGLLVPPGDKAALARELVRLLRDRAERQRLGAAAEARMRREFTWRAIARRTVAHYERALSSRS